MQWNERAMHDGEKVHDIAGLCVEALTMMATGPEYRERLLHHQMSQEYSSGHREIISIVRTLEIIVNVSAVHVYFISSDMK